MCSVRRAGRSPPDLLSGTALSAGNLEPSFIVVLTIDELLATVREPEKVHAAVVFACGIELRQYRNRKGFLLLSFLLAELNCDSSKSKRVCFYCCFRVLFISICSRLSRFSGYDCHQAMKMTKSCSVLEGFLFILLSVQKNHIGERQYGKYYFVYVLSFYDALAVVNPKSKL